MTGSTRGTIGAFGTAALKLIRVCSSPIRKNLVDFMYYGPWKSSKPRVIRRVAHFEVIPTDAASSVSGSYFIKCMQPVPKRISRTP